MAFYCDFDICASLLQQLPHALRDTLGAFIFARARATLDLGWG